MATTTDVRPLPYRRTHTEPLSGLALFRRRLAADVRRNRYIYLMLAPVVAYGLKLRGVPRSRWKELIQPCVDLVGLAGFENLYPYQLSGGMQQRAGLARALVLNPQVLLMDEPFGALDAQTRELLQEELVRILEQDQRTMVFITHSIDEAIVLGDRIVVMSTRPGRIREILDVGLPRPRNVAAARTSPRYAELRQHIWEELRPQVEVV